MDESGLKAARDLFRGYTLTVEPIQHIISYHDYTCPICHAHKLTTYVHSTAPIFWQVLVPLRIKNYGASTLLCSKECLIEFIQRHSADILIELIKRETL